MKKFLITFFVFLIVLLAVIILIINISNPSTKKENAFLTLNNELSITLPSEFIVSTTFEEDGIDPTTIFVATSSEDLLIIKMVPADENLNVTQKEVIDALYEEIKQMTVDKIGSETTNWSDVATTNFGENYFIYRNGLRYRYSEDSNYPINEGIRQYITYSNNKAFFVSFVNFFPNINKTKYWDQIVSSISFN